jgi:hypothetical protein
MYVALYKERRRGIRRRKRQDTADKKGRRAQPKLVTKEYLNERVPEMGGGGLTVTCHIDLHDSKGFDRTQTQFT